MKKRKKAIFLDRDGVLISNADHYYIWKKEDLILNPGVPAALSGLQRRGYLLIVVSNQGGVSKGLYSRMEVDRLHSYLQAQLMEHGVKLDAFYYCPHHHEHEACLCRKPAPLMLQKAMARFGISADDSWMVGDAGRDVEAGRRARLRTLLVEANGDLRLILAKIP